MISAWRYSISAALIGGLCACTQSGTTNTTAVVPDNVAPAPVNHTPYLGFSCEKLSQNQAYIAQELEEATRKPSENAPANVAHLKGESDAVKKAMAAKKCPSAG
jgi:hypothetical protein